VSHPVFWACACSRCIPARQVLASSSSDGGRAVSCAELAAASENVARALTAELPGGAVGPEDVCLIVVYPDAELRAAATRLERADCLWPFASQGGYVLALQLGVLRCVR
jgi:hypothetical protein